MTNLDKMKALQESYKALARQISEGLANHLQVEDWSEGDEPDWRVALGNLPMGCPNCGRPRLNFHPDLPRIDCEKCDWYSGASIPEDALTNSHKWSGWQVEGVKIDVNTDSKEKTVKAQVSDGGNTLVYEGEDFGAEQALAHLLAKSMQRKSVLCKEDLVEVSRILWDHVDECEAFHYADEANNTRRILEKLGASG